MKKALILLLVCCNIAAIAQPQDTEQLLQTARAFQRQSDYENAILVLQKAEQAAPNDINVIKELAFTYYLQGMNDKGLAEIKKIVDRDDADEQIFQIAGSIYKSKQDLKEADKLYKKGLKKFPNSGPLYSEYGDVLYHKEPSANSAIAMWEKGIQIDPNYSGNYYYASRYYATTSNYLWCLLYGEMFVNIESYTTRTIEVKNILFDIYKQWFVSGKSTAANQFELQFASSLNKQSREANYGINAENLTVIRTKFILEWFNSSASRPAFRLFDFQKKLLQEGLFEAYNQWLFGSVSSTSAYQSWVSSHQQENSAFLSFQRGGIFNVPAGQYYGNPQ